ncbi:uncharacterized protein [Watersipora subatra]|uniref:uncharacterized protein n=1 Tax=Watersipora subatra TaxID=2589382 RepID=UPI00355BAEB9
MSQYESLMLPWQTKNHLVTYTSDKTHKALICCCTSGLCDYGPSQELSTGQSVFLSAAMRSTAGSRTPPPLFYTDSKDDPQPPPNPPTVLNVDDFCIMKASSESYKATRSDTHGSFFIRILVYTFYKHACHRDVETLFKIIQDRVRQVSTIKPNYTMGGNVITMNCTFTHFRKLYFFPGFSKRILH